MSALKRGRNKNVEDVGVQESTQSSMNDLPPEILEQILKKLDDAENSMLSCRRVHSSWKQIIDDHLGKKSLKGELFGCFKAFIVNPGWLGIPLPRIRIPQAILHHPGNPFPSRALHVTQKCFGFDQRGGNDRRISHTPLTTFVFKFGSHLNTLVLDRANLKFSTLIQILTPLSNLRILKLSRLYINLYSADDLDSFPSLPHLTTMEHKFLNVTTYEDEIHRKNLFFTKLMEAYSDHLVNLGLGS